MSNPNEEQIAPFSNLFSPPPINISPENKTSKKSGSKKKVKSDPKTKYYPHFQKQVATPNIPLFEPEGDLKELTKDFQTLELKETTKDVFHFVDNIFTQLNPCLHSQTLMEIT